MGSSSVRIGVDIGGTFTDVVLEIDGRPFSAKLLTTYAAPEDAIVEGILKVCGKAGIAPAAVGQIIHGTTLATNALIERRGAKTALITTEGFRDVIEMRTESRFEQYDLNLVLPKPLLPRQRRYTVKERVDADGGVLLPLDVAEVEALADRLAEADYESIAVGLIHAYMNGEHERRIGEVLAKKLPDAMISLSSEVSPQMREYERFNTTVANAYIKPLMKSYLARLEGRIRDEGIVCPIFLMHSGGGIISIESAAEFPVRLVESGPAGGAVFAADIAARYGLEKVLSFDMGGTTAKICLIKNQTPKTSRVFEAARSYRFKKGSGMPISIPVIDMVEIGAGGGSLAHVDSMRQIRVGPESAGSEPGPACYGRGGKRPAVTDADLVLGRLDPDNFAGGSIALSPANSEAALDEALGLHLAMDTETAAFGVAEVVDENMANAARVHAVENGEDLSEYTMIAFGGAAPLHAGRLCEKLGVERLLVPPGAGVGSAIGFLRAPFSFEATKSVYMRLSAFDLGAAASILRDLQGEATAFVRSCDAEADIRAEFKVYMRYTGQGWEIPIALDAEDASSPNAERFFALFEREYEKLFGRAVEGMDVEITVWAVNATTPLKTPTKVAAAEAGGIADIAGERRLFDPALGKHVEANVVLRDAVATGETVEGPAAITEDETTIILPTSRHAIRQPDGCIDITLKATLSTAIPSVKGQAVNALSDVARQVMWNRLISVVEEQAQALVRTAFSTSVREAGDLSAGVYDTEGRMLAQAVTGTPGHVNAMAESVGHFIRRIGRQNMFEGDVLITNDPWEGTGHLHDITVVTPTFLDGYLVGFFACTAHITDIGGRGFGADANSVYEEGLYIPVMKFAERGEVDKTLIKMIRGNVREPDQLVGDIYALATCNEVGQRRLIDMMREFGLKDLNDIAGFILENSKRATIERIADLPKRDAPGALRIDGYDHPIDLKVKLAIEDDRITCDFAGTSDVDKKGINVPLVYTKAYACYALKCAIAPEIPNNTASLEPFETTAPEGSILNAPHPAPVALRHIIGHMIPDTVYSALDQILPETVPAEGAGCLCNFQVSLRPRTDAPAPPDTRRSEVLTFNSGGSGARPGLDGMNATAFPSGVMTMPIEATEQVGPVLIWRKELRADSGGSGRQRGGLGQFMEVGAREGHEFDIQAMFDRVDHPARGRQGGKDGAATTIGRDDGEPMRGKGKQFVPHGRKVMLAFPGGAGYGDPAERDRDAVIRDLAEGYISAETAMRDYGLSEADIDAVTDAVRRGEMV
jgi:N-methylhydantoinase A/oxoprolinase/acetone carboxylase beta subunit/N-methylhydantoinase B/oxoprolinase/acetone carboxylase alpha subunit